MARHRQERKTPVGTIVGVVFCLAAIGGFLALVMTGKIRSGGQDEAVRAPSGGRAGGESATGTGSNPNTTAKPVIDSGAIKVSFPVQSTGGRRLVFSCPHCSGEIKDFIPNCPLCQKAVKWPETVPCGFCDKSGVCKDCGGDGKCAACTRARRLPMGVKPPCDVCRNTEKCSTCRGTGKCDRCEAGILNLKKGPAKSVLESPTPPPIPKPQD